MARLFLFVFVLPLLWLIKIILGLFAGALMKRWGPVKTWLRRVEEDS